MFIQVMQGRCTDPDKLHTQLDAWHRTLEAGAPGFLGGTYGITDDDEFVAVVRFDSRETAMANSSRPEQGVWWEETARCFDGDVDFHDCDDVHLLLGGGSDSAGFVQVIQGRIADQEKFRMLVDAPMDHLQQQRPEILGGTIAVGRDGFFTQTIAFTTEAEARAGEKKEMPPEMAEMMATMDAAMTDLTFHDLRQPWFETARQPD